METTLAIVIALSACSGWAAVILQWWSQRNDWLRAKFVVSLDDWRKQTEQTRILYEVAEDLCFALSQERGVPHQTLKRDFREQAAKKLDSDCQLDLLAPWRLRATLRKIEGRKQHLEAGLRLYFPKRKRIAHQKAAGQPRNARP